MKISFSADAAASQRPPIIILLTPSSGMPGPESDGMAMNFIKDVRSGAQSVVGNVSQSEARLNRLA